MSVHNITVDLNDSSSVMTEGSWIKSVSSDGKPLLLTTSPNASVVFLFDGSFISVVGSLDSNMTNSTADLAYTLDGYDDPTYTPESNSGLLYASYDLTSGHHTLKMTLKSNATQLSLQSVTITKEEQTSRRNNSALVGGVIGGVVFLVLVLLSLLFYRRRRIRRANTARRSLQLQVNLPDSKEAFTSGKNGSHGLPFTPSPSSSSANTFTSIPLRKLSLRSRQPDFTLLRTMHNVPTVNFDEII